MVCAVSQRMGPDAKWGHYPECPGRAVRAARYPLLTRVAQAVPPQKEEGIVGTTPRVIVLASWLLAGKQQEKGTLKKGILCHMR